MDAKSNLLLSLFLKGSGPHPTLGGQSLPYCILLLTCIKLVFEKKLLLQSICSNILFNHSVLVELDFI